jgi:uncharacterized protein with PIN domain
MKLSKQQLKSLIAFVGQTSTEEIGCGKCYEKLHKFAEKKLEGKSPEEAMPLVQKHLKLCYECREEYKSLLKALKALQ